MEVRFSPTFHASYLIHYQLKRNTFRLYSCKSQHIEICLCFYEMQQSSVQRKPTIAFQICWISRGESWRRPWRMHQWAASPRLSESNIWRGKRSGRDIRVHHLSGSDASPQIQTQLPLRPASKHSQASVPETSRDVCVPRSETESEQCGWSRWRVYFTASHLAK